MRLALLGDIHAYRLIVPPWRLLGKRFLGQVNLWLNRRRQFDLRLLPPVLRRIGSLAPDLLLLSGDLSTTAIESEFSDVAAMLHALDPVPDTLIVPGNHDRYTFASRRCRTMERMFAPMVPDRFPHVRRLDKRWYLIALDAAVPRIGSSRGRIGSAQLGAFAQFLAGLKSEDGVVVLCHYPFGTPPRAGMPWGHRLADAARLRALLCSTRSRILYLHGHVHRPWCWQPDDPDLSHLVAVNAGSPTLREEGRSLGQGFWQIELPEDPHGPVRLFQHEPDQDLPRSGDWRVLETLGNEAWTGR